MQKLLVNQAILDSVEVKEEIVDRELNARFDEILARINNDPAFFEEYYGKSVAEKKESLRDPIRDKIMAEMMQNKVVTDVKITPEEVAGFFNAIPKDSLPYFGSEVELSELLYVPQANKEEKLRIKAKLNDIRQQIIDGKEKTGVTIMQMDAGLDTGPMLLAQAIPVGYFVGYRLLQAVDMRGLNLVTAWTLLAAGTKLVFDGLAG